MDIVTLAAARKGGGSGGDVTKQYVDDHLALKADKVETKEYPIASTTTGVNPSITDSADGYVQSITIYGRTDTVEGELHGIGEEGELNVETCGKNLLNPATIGLYQAISDPSVIRAGYAPIYVHAGTYTLSYIKTSINITLWITDISDYSYEQVQPNGKYVVTSDTYIMVRSALDTVEAFKYSFTNIQLELGSTATAYEPYVSTSATVTTGIPLYADGNIKDELNAKKGVVIKRCEKTTEQGEEIIVPLATPVEIPLTASELSALRSLKTYSPTTNVTATDAPTVDVGYLLNTDNGQAVADVQNELQEQIPTFIASIPEMHRNIFRGQSLGSTVTAAQIAAIADGSFDDLYVGDYWTIPVTIDGTTINVNWRIADIDYYLHTGDTPLTAHHLVIVPDTGLYAARMNTTNINTGGYKASEMYTTNLGTAKTAINTAFPDMVLTHRDLMLGNPADTPTWADSTVELLSEIMTHGTQIMSPCNGSGQYNIFWMIAKSQLALFRLAPWFGVADDTYWLRDVVGSPSFAAVSAEGTAEGWGASNELGVRPYFLLGSAE